jgi:uracil-DNA glycosylase
MGTPLWGGRRGRRARRNGPTPYSALVDTIGPWHNQVSRKHQMKSIGTFPFGQLVCEVEQKDRTSKDVFVLGVYASAVHARWINKSEKTVVNALAVASEPYIFWRGENAESIIQQIVIPEEIGKLIPAKQDFNGPSGITLDNLILHPLELERQRVWLCDLVPHSCVNPSQRKAIERAYLPIASKYGLAKPTVPPVPTMLADDNRRKAILAEIIESEAKTLILLGDKPIQWFLSYFDNRWGKLSDFGHDSQSYGQLHKVRIGDKEMDVLPLAHPRQIARLGQSSAVWYDSHEKWLMQSASKIAQCIKLG